MSKESFVFFEDWANYILALPDADAVELARAILAKGVGKEYEISNPAVKIYFDAVIAPDMDTNAKAKEEYREKQAAKGRAGGLAKARNAKQNLATANTGQPQLAKSSKLSLIDGDGYGYGISAYADINNAREAEQINLQEILPEKVATELQKWLDVRQTIGRFPYTAITATISMTNEAIKKFGEDACIEAIKTATAGAHKAIYYDRLIKPPRDTKKNPWNIESHKYDWSVLDG